MEKLRDITEQISSQDEEQRRLAVIALAEYPAAQVKELLYQAMGDNSWRIRKEAVEALFTFSVTEEIVEDLIGLLRSQENAGLRNSAVEALGKLGVRAVPNLSRYVHDADNDVRKFVMDILGEIGAAEALPLLVEALDDPDPNVCAAVIENLGKIGDAAAVPHLLKLLSRTDVWLRFTILEALVRIGKPVPVNEIILLAQENLLKKAVFDCLGAIGDVEAVPLLLQGLQERIKSAREAAAGALMKIRERLPAEVADQLIDCGLRELKDTPYVEGLLASLNTVDRHIKEALVEMLGIIGDERAVSRLLVVCNDGRLRKRCFKAFESIGAGSAKHLITTFPSANEEERCFIAYLCGEFNFDGCTLVLKEGLQDADPMLRQVAAIATGKIGLTALLDEVAALLDDDESEVREGAIFALSRLAEEAGEAVQAKIQNLASSELPETRRHAAVLFAALGDTEKLSILVKDEDVAVRKAAVLSLAEIKAKSSVGHLIMALVDEDPDVRVAAAGALGDINGDEVLEPLLLALKDEDRWVKSAALKSLGKLRSEKAFRPVVEALSNAEGPVAIAALETLMLIDGNKAYETVKSALDNPDEEVVKSAIDLLSRMGNDWLDEYREKLLHHSHWDVRRSFIGVMGLLQGKEAVPYFKSALESESDNLVKGYLAEVMERLQ